MTPDMKVNIRLQLVAITKGEKTVPELTELFDWIVAAAAVPNILPVQSFQVKNG
jgi:hypothetical protein